MKIIISYLNIKQNIFFKMSNYIDKRNTHFKKYIISPSKNFGLVNTINDICEETKKGKQHLLIAKYQQKYGNSLSCNITIPYTYKDEKSVRGYNEEF